MIQKITYGIFRLLVFGIGLLPFSWLYAFSKCIFYLLYHVTGYRRAVVAKNLKIAFPDKSEKEIQTLSLSFYQQFADVILETLKGLNMSPEDFRKRYHFTNADIFQSLVEENRSALIVGGHFGNWEWGSFSFPLWVDAAVVGIYKPLKNRFIEKFLTQKRARFGLQLAKMDQAGRAFLKNKNKPVLFVLIADQGPSNLKAAHWVSFFNKTTPFLNGVGKIAVKTNLPVYYYDIQRTQRGHYSISFQLLCASPKDYTPEQITEQYKEKLEQSIRQSPTLWLWSHRRWRRVKEL